MIRFSVARSGQSPTLAIEVQARLREEILKGHLLPEQRLMASELGRRLGVSQSVVREGLMQLVNQQLVVLEHNRGFRVTSLSPKDLQDLTSVRKLNESAAIALSIEHGSVNWESDVLASHHRLTRLPIAGSDASSGPTDEWQKAHRKFHSCLYEACDNPLLFRICESLADRSDLYRRWLITDPASPYRDLEDEHTKLMEAVLSRDKQRAVDRLHAHRDRTTENVLTDWQARDRPVLSDGHLDGTGSTSVRQRPPTRAT